jgi:hypothetical protein
MNSVSRREKMPRTGKTIASLVALAVLGSTPALAQSNWNNRATSGWDREAFWREAPSDLRQRVDWLQRRIDRGVSDGSLDRRDARDLYRQLDMIRIDARRGYMTSDRRDRLQARLDSLSSQIRWQRQGGDRTGYGDNNYDRGRFDESRFATNYDASRYYRDDSRYTERRLSPQDEVYRGSDGRYYCKRNDGTTGLIIGAVGGGVLGNVIDGGRNRVGGTLIGGALGAILGGAVGSASNNDVRCR